MLETLLLSVRPGVKFIVFVVCCYVTEGTILPFFSRSLWFIAHM